MQTNYIRQGKSFWTNASNRNTANRKEQRKIKRGFPSISHNDNKNKVQSHYNINQTQKNQK